MQSIIEAIINFIVSAILALFGLGYVEPEPAYVEPPYVECGTCGAHVSSWWYVTSDVGEPIQVCEWCYLRIAQDDYYWPWD